MSRQNAGVRYAPSVRRTSCDATMPLRPSSRPTDVPTASFRRQTCVLSIVTVVALAVAGCEGSTSVVTMTSPTPSKCQLTVASPAMIVADGGAGAFAVTAQPECAWSASAQASWITELSPASGQGTATVTFRATPNPVPSAREAEIIINEDHVRVSQEGAPCRLAIAPVEQTISGSGGTASVAVSVLTGCGWTARSNAPWITIASADAGNGNGSVSLRVAASNGGSRTGTVSIGDRTHTLTQGTASEPPPPTPPPGPECTFTINPVSQAIAATGGAGAPVTVTAATGCAWTAASNASWITVTSGANGSGNGSVAFTVGANTGASRSGTITIATHTFTLNQAAEPGPPPPPPPPPCTYSIDPASASVAAAGGPGAAAVTAGTACAWTATTTAAWITITSGAAGIGNGSVGFTVAANTGAERTGTIAIAGQAFMVTQAAAPPPPPPPCTYSIDPTSASLVAAGGTGSVAVTAGTACAWTATTTEPWVTITSGAAGTGSGSVGFTVAANTGAARTGTITIAGQAFTVTQAAAPPPPPPPCTYSIDPTGASVVAAGGTGSVAVTAGTACAWTATTTASWITITSGAAGIGNGTVAYGVAANPTGASRLGTVAIAGQTFKIVQSP